MPDRDIGTETSWALGLLRHDWHQDCSEPGGALCSHCEANYPGGSMRCPRAPVPSLRELRRMVNARIAKQAKKLASLHGLRRDLTLAIGLGDDPPSRAKDCEVCRAFATHLAECGLCAGPVEGPEGWCPSGLSLYQTPCLDDCPR